MVSIDLEIRISLALISASMLLESENFTCTQDDGEEEDAKQQVHVELG